LILRYCSNWI